MQLDEHCNSALLLSVVMDTAHFKQESASKLMELNPSPLLRTGDATLGMLRPVLGSTLEGRHGQTGKSWMKCH